MTLAGKHVVLGVTGGIAAYKACDLCSRLVKAGAQVRVVMTKNACQFVSPLTFETLSSAPVVNDTFARPETWEVEHVALAKWADLFVVAPATANIMAKLACGIADDMLSTTLLATEAAIMMAPAMNTGMWNNPATQKNLATLQARGVRFVGPDSGHLACGDSGAGRMSEPADILDAVERLLSVKHDLEGLRVLVNAGPTRELIDPVRYISNFSSGKMGYAIAEAAAERGAEVTLVTGPVNLTPSANVQTVIAVTSTEELRQAMLAHCAQADIMILAAAPADFAPVQAADQKIKKQGDGQLTLVLRQNPDVAAELGREKRAGQILIGFAAETENTVENAAAKLAKKNLDMIVANDVTLPGAGFNHDTNIVTFVTKEGTEALPVMPKRQVADELLNRALALHSR